MLIGMWAFAAFGATSSIFVDVPASPADRAVKQLAKQAGVLTLFESEEVAELETNAVVGWLTLEQALTAMTQDTPLTFELTNGGVIVLRLNAAQVASYGSADMVTKTSNATAGETSSSANESFGARGLLARIAGVFLLGGSGVNAPAMADEQPGIIIEEIIVTAERRQESVLKVPITMSAFGADRIEVLGVTNFEDLEQLVPGLQVGPLGETTGSGISIRGIGTQNYGETHADLAVATYVDGVYTLNTAGSIANNFDVERIEVARGPQGTLNGRNSIAGSISLHNRKPTDYWDLNTLFEVTDQTTTRIGIAGGGPITDFLSFRVKVQDFSGDGLQKNVGLGPDWDEPDERSITGQLRFHTERMELNLAYTDYSEEGIPRSLVRLFDINRDNPFEPSFYRYTGSVPSVSDCPDQRFDSAQDAIDSGRLEICDDLKNEINTNRVARRDVSRESFTWNFAFDITEEFTLLYTGGDTDYSSVVGRDQDGTNRVASDQINIYGTPIPQDCIDAYGLAECQDVGFVDSLSTNPYYFDEQSHELQIVSNFDGPLNFIAGLYYYEADTTFRSDIFDFAVDQSFYTTDPDTLAQETLLFGFIPSANCDEYLANIATVFGVAPGVGNFTDVSCGPPAGFKEFETFRSLSEADSKTRAAFVHLDWKVTDRWRASGGLRHTEDEKTNHFNGAIAYSGPQLGIGPFGYTIDEIEPNIGTPGFARDGSWDKLIWNAALEYAMSDEKLIYGRISTGYRPGAPNQGCCTFLALPDVQEETLINYELGFKGRMLDDRLQVTAGVFLQNFDGYQINGFTTLPLDFDFPPGTTTPIAESTVNVDGTDIWGAEVEFIWLMGERWVASGFYAYLDSELGNYSMVIPFAPDSIRERSPDPFPRIDAEEASPTFGTEVCTPEYVAANGDYPAPGESCFYLLPTDVTGNELPQQPHHKLALTLERFFPTETLGEFSALATYSYTGERYADVGNFYEIPAYDRVDLRLNWTSPSREWRATAFVQNVFDEVGLVEFFPSATVPFTGALTEPRQIGLQVVWQPNFRK